MSDLDSTLSLIAAIKPNMTELESLQRVRSPSQRIVMLIDVLRCAAQAVLWVTNGERDVTVRASPARTNMLGTILSGVEFSYLVRKDSASAASSTTTAPKQPNYDFKYELAATTAQSATMRFFVGVRNPMNFDWVFGDVELIGLYDGVAIAK